MNREPREVWSARVARLERSGLSIAAFAREEGLNPVTLGNWRRKLRGGAPQFVELLGGPSRGFDVELRGGHRVHVPEAFSAEALARLVAVLEARS